MHIVMYFLVAASERVNRTRLRARLGQLIQVLAAGVLFTHTSAGADLPGLQGSAYRGPGTEKMARRLEQIAKTANPMGNRFLSRERMLMLREQLPREQDPMRRFEMQGMLALETLNAGLSVEAIQEFKKLEVLLKENGLLELNDRYLSIYRALCQLRIAEQENCLANHTADSCLLPIRGGGVHKLKDGSRAAAEILTGLLNRTPDDLSARWLLNIASMTLGEYPDKVPPKWLIPPKTFDSDFDIKRFYDVAGPLGLDINELSGGCIVDDFDNDTFLDLMVSSFGLRDQIRFFHNNGDGTFSDRTLAAGLEGEVGGLNLLQTDYNNDGLLDVLILRGAWFGEEGRHPNSLLRNNGNGTFEDVTEAAGLLSFHPTQTAAWFDYNGDGWIDLFVGNETSAGAVHKCELFRNNGNGTFTECAAEAGADFVGFVKAVTAGDMNNDGRPDLYLSCLGEPNVLLRNDGVVGDPKDPKSRWKFTDIARTTGVTEPLFSFPTWFWDYDNDGWLDIFVAGYKIQHVSDIAADYLGLPHNGTRARLYRNNGNGTFSDVTKSNRLDKVLHAMGSNFGDLDNDGYLDFYVGTGDPNLETLIPNRMFRNAEGKTFQDVTTSGWFGHLQKGHAVSFADINNDGSQDVYAVMGGAYSGDNYRNVLFKNPGHGNHWLKLKLVGGRSNRAAIGSRIKVTVQTDAGPRTIRKTVGSGGSFGASPLRQEIGLGQARSIEAIEIYWPATGETQVFKNAEMDGCYVIREGQPKLARQELKAFALPAGGDHSHHHAH